MAITPQTKLQHLLWRAGFGPDTTSIVNYKGLNIAQVVDRLFADADSIKPLEQPPGVAFLRGRTKNQLNRKLIKKKEREHFARVNELWIKRMIEGESPLLERMTLFWHGHFACTSKFHSARNQNNSLRNHALGNFKSLLLAVAKDPAMIRFLNNQQNRKNSPNENFARELMELFTIGRGHYSETDVKEAARAFTGWSATIKDGFVFRQRQHDFGSKTFMGQTGNFNGEDIIDLLLEKKQTAHFVCRKIYKYFVNENVNDKHIKALANHFYQSSYDIKSTMMYLFKSDWFYEEQNIGTKIKSPVELLIGMSKLLNIEFNQPFAVIFLQKALGQVLFNPPNVAGWPGGKAWIDNSTLMLRMSLAGILYEKSEFDVKFKSKPKAQENKKRKKKLDASVDPSELIKLFMTKSDEDMISFLLQCELSTHQKILKEISSGGERESQLSRLLFTVMSTPEYQVC